MKLVLNDTIALLIIENPVSKNKEVAVTNMKTKQILTQFETGQSDPTHEMFMLFCLVENWLRYQKEETLPEFFQNYAQLRTIKNA
jgi:hypothetical protein